MVSIFVSRKYAPPVDRSCFPSLNGSDQDQEQTQTPNVKLPLDLVNHLNEIL